MFPDGSPILVTYYHRNISDIDIRTAPGDISPMAHPVHHDFTKIINFELRLLDSLNNSFDEEDNSFTITGEAITYPGFVPYIGDKFFFDIGDNKVGEFKINNVTPTSYRQGKYHRVVFEMMRYVDDEVFKQLEDGVKDTLYFDKNVYTGDGDWTFLKQESYLQLQTLKLKHKELIQYYVKKFYSEAYESFLRPDGIYDPYIVEFLRKRLSLKEAKVRPSQLYTRLKDYHLSIWYMFTDSIYYAEFTHLNKNYTVEYLQADALSTDHNALINRHYIGLTSSDERSELYIFTDKFYGGGKDLMTPLERTVFEYITTKKINIESVLSFLDTYRNLDINNQFYQIPVLIELISVSINSIEK